MFSRHLFWSLKTKHLNFLEHRKNPYLTRKSILGGWKYEATGRKVSKLVKQNSKCVFQQN